MKTISLLFITLILVTSCSQDNIINSEPLFKFPTNISLSNKNIGIGDILTISGDGFLPSESYKITFTDNLIGNIVETGNGYLKVIVPDNSETGNISLTYKNQTEIIGSIQINTSLEQTKIFGYVIKDGIIELDSKNGSINNTLAYLGPSFFSILGYSETLNTLFGIQGGFSDCDFVKIDAGTGEIHRIKMEYPDFENFTVSNNGQIYGYVIEDGIIEIDPNNGSIIRSIAYLGPRFFSMIGFSEASNKIIGIQGHFPDSDFVKIDIKTGEVSRIAMQYPDFENFAIGN